MRGRCVRHASRGLTWPNSGRVAEHMGDSTSITARSASHPVGKSSDIRTEYKARGTKLFVIDTNALISREAPIHGREDNHHDNITYVVTLVETEHSVHG